MQEFLGLPYNYRKYIKTFFYITYPITNLMKQDVSFEWTDECQKAFNILKERLKKYLILQQLNFS